jgi:hypothetical protein
LATQDGVTSPRAFSEISGPAGTGGVTGVVESRVQRRLLVLLIAIGLGAALVGCGGNDDRSEAAADDDEVPSGGNGDDQRYEFVGTVAQTEERGPELCIGAAIMIFPPQCGGIPVDQWVWEDVPGAQEEGGTSWVDQIRVVGTFDGELFHLTEVPSLPEGLGGPAIDVPADFPPLCTPEVTDDTMTGGDDFEAASTTAGALASKSAFWVSRPAGPAEERVVNVIVTADAAAVTEDLRTLWGGGLCVVERPETPTEAQLTDISNRLPDLLGADYLGGWTDPERGLAIAQVKLATDKLRTQLDAEFGPGTVELSPALKPL